MASGAGGWLVRFDDGALTGLDLLVGRFWQLEAKAGHIISAHAGDALQERVFDLGLTVRDEMDAAYRGERTTPSRCGRMDQVSYIF